MPFMESFPAGFFTPIVSSIRCHPPGEGISSSNALLFSSIKSFSFLFMYILLFQQLKQPLFAPFVLGTYCGLCYLQYFSNFFMIISFQQVERQDGSIPIG